MKLVRKRLTYANVMSSIAVFLVLGGATAFAAGHLGKNTVGSKQLKNNAVTAAKIKSAAITGAKIKDGAITAGKLAGGAVSGAQLAPGAVGGSQLADGSVTGSKLANGAVGTSKIADGAVTGQQINAGTTPFSQVVARVRGVGSYGLSSTLTLAPVGSYTQPAGEDDTYIAGMDVTFSAACISPRSVAVYLALDPANPATLSSISEIAGYGVVEDRGTGAVTKRLEIGNYPGGGGTLNRMAPASATSHSFYIAPASVSCSSGSGASASNVGVDVIGTK
jgi:hypothetical protein